MFTAIMDYEFLPDKFDDACRAWQEIVPEAAEGREGLVSLQLLAAAPRARAIGTWEEKRFAEAFMATAIFKRLKERLEPFLVRRPEPTTWESRYRVAYR